MSSDVGDMEESALMPATSEDEEDDDEYEDTDDENEEDGEYNEEDDDEEDESPPQVAMHLASLLGIRTRERGETGLAARFPRLPQPPKPLKHEELSFDLMRATRGHGKRQKSTWPFHPCDVLLSKLPGLVDDSGRSLHSDSSSPLNVDGSGSSRKKKASSATRFSSTLSASGPLTRSRKKANEGGGEGGHNLLLNKDISSSLAAARVTDSRSPSSVLSGSISSMIETVPFGRLLAARETVTNGRPSGHYGFSPSQQRHMQCLTKRVEPDEDEEASEGRSKHWMNSRPVSRNNQGIGRNSAGGGGGGGDGRVNSSSSVDTTSYLRNVLGPLHPGSSHLVDSLEARAYIGQYSKDGSFYIAAFQDERVRLYDVNRGWALRKDVRTRMCRWTVTDTCLSPDQKFLVYSSMHPIVNLVAVGRREDDGDGVVESISNITQVHETLHFDQWTGSEAGRAHEARYRDFSIFSVKWSGDGKELIAGTSDENVYVFDVETSRVVAFATGHEDDVNSVAYLDADSPFVFASASDDTYIKVWDRRIIDQSCKCKCVGVLVGHTEGLSHIDAKGDGRYLLSNSKDQTAKIWDLRTSLVSDAEENAQPNIPPVPRFRWDYRWMAYPGAGFAISHPRDRSIATFRGHEVRQTLIRAHWSPAFSTGQRYIYSGGADGVVRVWDALTGEVVREMKQHRSLVRDCSWHPYLPHITSVSWDGTVVQTRL